MIKTKYSLKPLEGRASGWLSWVNVALDFGSGHNLTVRGFKPCVRLCADRSEPGACFGFCVSLSVCLSPVHALSPSVSKIK